MCKRKTCKTCVHYLHKWKKSESSDRFTGNCTLYPPEWVKRDPSEVSDTEKKLGRSSVSSLFRFTNETDYCGQHMTKIGKALKDWYPLICVVVGAVLGATLTTIGLYIVQHILTEP